MPWSSPNISVTYDFGYNAAGQITQSTRSNDLYAFTGHTSGTIGETSNGLNQLANRGGVSLSYHGAAECAT